MTGGRDKQQCYRARFSDSPMRGTVQTTIQPTRLTPDERGTIQRAALLCNQTMSTLMRAAALEYAQRMLERTT